MSESVNSTNIFDLLEDEAPPAGMPLAPEESAPRVSGKSARGKAHTRGVDRAAAAAVRPGKREHDRQSANGVPKGMKKGGHGKGNWGSLKDAEADGVEVVEAETAAAEAPVEAPVQEQPKKQTQAPAPVEEEDESAKFKTLEQYQAELAKQTIDEEKKGRDVVVDDKKFKKCEVLQAGGDENPFAELVKPKNNKKKEKAKKEAISLDQFIGDMPREVEEERPRFEGRGRGRGRGGFRGGRGRGGYNNGEAPVTVDAAAPAAPAAAAPASGDAAVAAPEAGDAAAPEAGAEFGGRGRGRGRGFRGRGRGGYRGDNNDGNDGGDNFRPRGRGGFRGRGRGGFRGDSDNVAAAGATTAAGAEAGADNGGFRGRGRGRGGRGGYENRGGRGGYENRGGRGGYESRGRGGSRGGFRDNRPNFVADDTAFPALSAKTPAK